MRALFTCMCVALLALVLAPPGYAAPLVQYEMTIAIDFAPELGPALDDAIVDLSAPVPWSYETSALSAGDTAYVPRSHDHRLYDDGAPSASIITFRRLRTHRAQHRLCS